MYRYIKCRVAQPGRLYNLGESVIEKLIYSLRF